MNKGEGMMLGVFIKRQGKSIKKLRAKRILARSSMD